MKTKRRQNSKVLEQPSLGVSADEQSQMGEMTKVVPTTCKTGDEQKTSAPDDRKQAEALIARQVFESMLQNPRTPGVKLETDAETGRVTLGFDHENDLCAQALAMRFIGTTDPRFFKTLISQISQMSGVGRGNSEASLKASEKAIDFTLAVIIGIGPQDTVEAMLASQMAATHMATLNIAGDLHNAKYQGQFEAYEKALNRLSRTFATQMQTLKKYRSKGEQVFRVEKVTIEDGGQAIVGPVSKGGGDGKD